MTSPHLAQTATSALAELLEVSPQVDAAVVFERTSSALLAHAPTHAEDRTRRFATVAAKLLDAAEQARTELGREPVTQCEVATGEGHVFVVADAGHVVAAVTAADPTVGLVFYDLKTALRAVRDAASIGSNGAALPAQSASSPATPAPASGHTEGGGPVAPAAAPDLATDLDLDDDEGPALDDANLDSALDTDDDSVGTGRFRRRKT